MEIRDAILAALTDQAAGLDVATYGDLITRAEVADRAGCSIKAVSRSADWAAYKAGELALPAADAQPADEPQPLAVKSVRPPLLPMLVALGLAALLCLGQLWRGCGMDGAPAGPTTEQDGMVAGVLCGLADVVIRDGTLDPPRLVTVAEFNRCFFEAFALAGVVAPKVTIDPRPAPGDVLTVELRQHIADALRKAAGVQPSPTDGAFLLRLRFLFRHREVARAWGYA